MSLINEALKRAKEAHQQAPVPPPDLPFRPVEPGQQRARRGLGLLLPALLGVVALLALFLVWQYAQTHKPTVTTAASTPFAPPTPRATAPAVAPQPDLSVRPASAPLHVGAATNTLAVTPTTEPTNAPPADAILSNATNATAVVAASSPQPAPLRLQGILYNPKRPSAMISGRTVFVGDRLGEFRVMTIDKDSATLVGDGQTNVLSLAD